MTDIRDKLEEIKHDDMQRFLIVRTAMRRAYLMAINATVGITRYQSEDDTFMDAIDLKVEMLMKRAGVQTPMNENTQPESNASDPFSLITRPLNGKVGSKESEDAVGDALTAKANFDPVNSSKTVDWLQGKQQ